MSIPEVRNHKIIVNIYGFEGLNAEGSTWGRQYAGGRHGLVIEEENDSNSENDNNSNR